MLFKQFSNYHNLPYVFMYAKNGGKGKSKYDLDHVHNYGLSLVYFYVPFTLELIK